MYKLYKLLFCSYSQIY